MGRKESNQTNKNKMELSIVYILRDHRSAFPNYDVYLSLRIFFYLTNSVDPDEMPHHAAFHLGLHCQSTEYLFRGFPYTKGK